MNWQDCLRQVKTSLKQVKTCLVFVWKISPCCEIGMLFSRIEKIVYDKLRHAKKR